MRIISFNINGIRSAANKGLFDWLQTQSADVLAVQEIKARATDLSADMIHPTGLHGWFHHAEKPGYSGVGLYSRQTPEKIQIGFGNPEFDAEGRYIRADFADFSVISLYMPSGSSSPERQEAKFRFMAAFLPLLENLRREHREFIIVGDWNIAHREIDLKNWKSNQKNSGFLPEERAWLSDLFDKYGWVDVYRRLHPDTTGEAYTWWSNRGQAWANNVGWRIDYQIATPGIAAKAVSASIHKASRFSDHAPLIIDYSC